MDTMTTTKPNARSVSQRLRGRGITTGIVYTQTGYRTHDGRPADAPGVMVTGMTNTRYQGPQPTDVVYLYPVDPARPDGRPSPTYLEALANVLDGIGYTYEVTKSGSVFTITAMPA